MTPDELAAIRARYEATRARHVTLRDCARSLADVPALCDEVERAWALLLELVLWDDERCGLPKTVQVAEYDSLVMEGVAVIADDARRLLGESA